MENDVSIGRMYTATGIAVHRCNHSNIYQFHLKYIFIKWFYVRQSKSKYNGGEMYRVVFFKSLLLDKLILVRFFFILLISHEL